MAGDDGNLDPRYRRRTLNGRVIDPTTQRELRRYRNGQVRTIRMSTLIPLLVKFNLSYKELYEYAQGHRSNEGPGQSA